MIGQLEDNKILTFNKDYVIRQIHNTIRNHAKEQEQFMKQGAGGLSHTKTFGPLREWGLGKIHDSYTLFFRLGGAQTRTPMEHAEISRATMKPTGKMLQGTHESMHPSVRVRMALDGRGYDDKGEYESVALEDWKYEWTEYAQPDTPFQLTQPGEVGKLKDVEWVKIVKDKEIARMPEDKLAEFERVILRHWTAAEDNWEEGAESREGIVDSVRPMRRESGKLDSPSSRKRTKGPESAQRLESSGEGGNDNNQTIKHRRGLSIETGVQR